VIRPRGGLEAFFEMNLMACLKLQYVSGCLGLRSKIFTANNLRGASNVQAYLSEVNFMVFLFPERYELHQQRDENLQEGIYVKYWTIFVPH